MTRTIHIAGDSTAAPKGRDAAPETGWGMALPYYLDGVDVANHARNGRSSKSFMDEGRLAAIADVLEPGDVLLVQFGHNDAKTDDPARGTDPWTTYRKHLDAYLEVARTARAVPVLATPVERRRFDDGGVALEAHGEYPEAMRSLASLRGVPLVDVQRASLELWQRLGAQETTRYFLHTDDGRRDDTHFSPRGAGAVAALVAAGLVEAGVLATSDVRRLDEAVPHAWFSWPDAAPS